MVKFITDLYVLPSSLFYELVDNIYCIFMFSDSLFPVSKVDQIITKVKESYENIYLVCITL